MKYPCIIKRLPVCMLLSLLCLLSACAPTPENAQIADAIRVSLLEEAAPPVLEFDAMQVPVRSSGAANAVLWTADEELQRNYALKYDRAARAFRVISFTTGRKSADGTYYAVPNDTSLTLTELAPCFDFSDDFAQKYLLLYAGEGDDLAALRAEFEGANLSGFTAEQLAGFEVCDLGGEALVLLVPRYEGLSVWINEVEHQGDLMATGAEVARFGARPVYIYCDFSDKLPDYEIHVSFDGLDEFFLTRETLLNYIK